MARMVDSKPRKKGNPFKRIAQGDSPIPGPQPYGFDVKKGILFGHMPGTYSALPRTSYPKDAANDNKRIYLVK